MELHEIKKEVTRIERENPDKRVAVDVARLNRVGRPSKISCEITVR